MLELIKQESNLTFTENGAVTYRSTGSKCLDLFSSIGALRHRNDYDILSRFIPAFTENRDLAIKILFYTRDIRGGLGERHIFRVIINWLANNEPNSIIKNIENISEYGRFDDLLSLIGTPCEKNVIEYLKKQFETDIHNITVDNDISLLAKWLPSINASSVETVKLAKKIAKSFNMNQKEYRKNLSLLRRKIKIIENNLREKDYTFDYSKQPSRAMFKYKNAFIRNDKERYSNFLLNVAQGTEKMNTENICPYELVEPYINDGFWTRENGFMRKISDEEKQVINTTWNNLPDFGGNENAIAVIDTSSSMYWQNKPMPAAVALSLGLYFAERNNGVFKNHFIEFSNTPQLIEIKGDTFCERLRYISTFNEMANTNLESVFELILNTAVKNNVPQKDLPSKLIIISDMEFDCCVFNASQTNFNSVKKRFTYYGYHLPKVVFWNVASRNRQQPVKENEQGVALISGATPRIFSMVAGDIISPYNFMIKTIENERYSNIVA